MYKSTELLDQGIEFFNTIKEKFEKDYDIITTKPFLTGRINIRKDYIKTKGIRIKIKRKESLIKFKKHIGFEDIEKQKRLNKITA